MESQGEDAINCNFIGHFAGELLFNSFLPSRIWAIMLDYCVPTFVKHTDYSPMYRYRIPTKIFSSKFLKIRLIATKLHLHQIFYSSPGNVDKEELKEIANAGDSEQPFPTQQSSNKESKQALSPFLFHGTKDPFKPF